MWSKSSRVKPFQTDCTAIRLFLMSSRVSRAHFFLSLKNNNPLSRGIAACPLTCSRTSHPKNRLLMIFGTWPLYVFKGVRVHMEISLNLEHHPGVPMTGAAASPTSRPPTWLCLVCLPPSLVAAPASSVLPKNTLGPVFSTCMCSTFPPSRKLLTQVSLPRLQLKRHLL